MACISTRIHHIEIIIIGFDFFPIAFLFYLRPFHSHLIEPYVRLGVVVAAAAAADIVDGTAVHDHTACHEVETQNYNIYSN